MHVEVDLNWFLRFIVTPFLVAFGLLHIVRNTASKYFVVDSNSESDYSFDRNKEKMAAAGGGAADLCVVCERITKKQCARCKMVKYCSEACQKSHWSEHKKKCNDLQLSHKANSLQTTSMLRGRKASLVPAGGSSKIFKQPKEILFPYEEFVELFNWDNPGFPPCGLLNCGNSCFANVVLQCLAYTRPLVAYLLEKGHRRECQHDDWCFMCEFQTHVERASRSMQPFSPINILSRLPNIGGNLGYGKQEDAHEFMRFAIDTMQSVCLDEFGGEKAVHPRSQETTLIQHIFGGHLQSQVICTNCDNVSNQFENMMDLTVEIHGNAASLEECLDQFTAKEWLDGDNMYKCDGCNDYVMAWKRLAVRRAPNILTIALKRFQSGRFGKLNKRVTFPETLNLSRYMNESEDGNDVYKLYAVIVHVDMLNASFFGHYICYVKDFRGNWYRIDDCKVARVDLDEVLSQGAYMLLYNRICPRPSCLLPAESLRKEEKENMKIEVHPSLKQPAECFSPVGCLGSPVDSGPLASVKFSGSKISNDEEDLSSSTDSVDARGDIEMADSEASPSIVKDVECLYSNGYFVAPGEVDCAADEHAHQPATGNISVICTSSTQSEVQNIKLSSPMTDVENVSGGSKNVNEGLLEIVGEDYSDTQNHISEKGSKAHDVSAMAFTSDKVHDALNSTNFISTPRIAKNENNISSPHGIQDVARKSNGVSSSGVKLKPFLAPGFLGKRPRNKCVEQEGISELASNSHLNSQTNGIAKPHLTCQNGYLFQDEEKHYSGRSCSSHNLDGQTGMFDSDTEMASVESDMSISLENGISSNPIAFCNGTKLDNTNERLMIGGRNMIFRGKSHG
ncbi:ubiquitin carboxyl-terminal hydrolase 18-like [Forsythia ovata]|uniref:Ubiquitin carboxyl-terminal hydrolase 18-like n=1 Tax=Forsythia ovata TaxID=205694 RepID=A0ABD1W4G3_9LAMI